MGHHLQPVESSEDHLQSVLTGSRPTTHSSQPGTTRVPSAGYQIINLKDLRCVKVEANDAVAVPGMTRPKLLPNELLSDLSESLLLSCSVSGLCIRHPICYVGNMVSQRPQHLNSTYIILKLFKISTNNSDQGYDIEMSLLEIEIKAVKARLRHHRCEF
ncbi:hypothetical protein Sjap_019575 [Stephania japonica]|uniref:Uncharacterized protein n=1 Tax=Stephania japonica TaxID=461633 RepID=A0AAP0EZ24_9MAGN